MLLISAGMSLENIFCWGCVMTSSTLETKYKKKFSEKTTFDYNYNI